MATPRIVAFGGRPEQPVWDYVLDLPGRERPRLLYVPTAAADDPRSIVDVYDRFRGRADVSHAAFFPWPPENLRERALSDRREELLAEFPTAMAAGKVTNNWRSTAKELYHNWLRYISAAKKEELRDVRGSE